MTNEQGSHGRTPDEQTQAHKEAAVEASRLGHDEAATAHQEEIQQIGIAEVRAAANRRRLLGEARDAHKAAVKAHDDAGGLVMDALAASIAAEKADAKLQDPPAEAGAACEDGRYACRGEEEQSHLGIASSTHAAAVEAYTVLTDAYDAHPPSDPTKEEQVRAFAAQNRQSARLHEEAAERHGDAIYTCDTAARLLRDDKKDANLYSNQAEDASAEAAEATRHTDEPDLCEKYEHTGAERDPAECHEIAAQIHRDLEAVHKRLAVELREE